MTRTNFNTSVCTSQLVQSAVLTSVFWLAAFARADERIIIEDSLVGSTKGTVVGGQLSPNGYQPKEKTRHILYRLPLTIRHGYMEFEVHGMSPDIPEDSSHAFFGMYEGRGLEEPIKYAMDFRENHFRFHGHWRQNRNSFKAVISCARPSQDNNETTPAIFETKNGKANRDWSEEPTGDNFDWDPKRWHKFRVAWGEGRFEVAIDGKQVWAVQNAPFEYAPLEQRIWLGSAPGRDNKLHNELPKITYRNFRLVALSPENQPQKSTSDVQLNRAATWTQPLRVDAKYPHHFRNEDNDHPFIFNKTAWHYFTCRHPEITLDRAQRIGANVIRVHLEGNPYNEALGLDAWPWGGSRQSPDFDSFNDDYWDEVESRIKAAGERGIGLNLTLFMKLKLPDRPESFQRVLPYLRRVIDRLAKYPNIFCWEVHNEHSNNPDFQAQVGRFMKTNDPFKRPVISSNGTTDNPLWPNADWMDMALVHHCTGSTPTYDLRDWYLAIARNLRVFGKPAFNNEPGRERRHANNDAVHRRKQLWIAAASGGYTTWHSWDGCEGIDDSVYAAKGEQYVRPFVDWWSARDFWRVDPTFTTLTLSDTDPNRNELIPAVLTSQTKDLTLAYLFTRSGGLEIKDQNVLLRLQDGRYRVAFYKPASGKVIGQTIAIEASRRQGVQTLKLPTFTDDLALQIEQIRKGENTLIDGTQ
ncbi:DUF4038 domain-containing protein [Stieleria sp. JC731]|uniref:apiosidase-like domain-containing protein n=1 Tax=Pirellulaceae TaxID=2691357 RepID=UPI001E40F7B0|nr:DUF4038 domain-containing protein [Stieleria sp. JC731]MCC9602602.1 DUF4038 domain-containing protein [Stieleria sp. JC731]